MPRHSDSLILVWQVDGAEASNLKAAAIEPFPLLKFLL